MMNQEKGDHIKEKIEKYLTLMNLKFDWNPELKAFLLNYRIEGRKYTVIIDWTNNWIVMRAEILPASEVPRNRIEMLCRLLLRANHDLPEVRYDLDEEGNIGTSQQVEIDACLFDVFEEEFYAVPFAIKYFWTDIAPKIEFKERRKPIEFMYT